MSEIEKAEAMQENETEEVPYKKEPKQNYVIYTIISVALFFVLYFGKEFIEGRINANYYMTINGSTLNESQLEYLTEYTMVECDAVKGITLTHINRASTIAITYENVGDREVFTENCILYEYGDVVSDIRREIYPYGNSIPEYVYAEAYVNIENPEICCYVYEYDGATFAEYTSDEITSEISALFMNSEKISLN